MTETPTTATAETAAATQTPASTPAPVSTPAVSTTGFDWKGVGIDDTGMNLINDRQWKNPNDLLTSYVNLEKVRGVPLERLVTLPKDNDAKAWNEVYTKLGRPETADKYTIPVPEGDKGEFANMVKPVFHKIGLTGSQATELATWWNEQQAATQKTQTAQAAEQAQISVNELKQAWGPKYDTNAAVVDKAAESFGMTQDQLSALKQTLGPKGAMTFLYNIGSKLGAEDASVPGLGNKTGFGMSPEAAQAKITALKHDRTFSQLFNSQDPKQRMDARAEMDRLHQLAYPGFTEYGGAAQAKT